MVRISESEMNNQVLSPRAKTVVMCVCILCVMCILGLSILFYYQLYTHFGVSSYQCKLLYNGNQLESKKACLT